MSSNPGDTGQTVGFSFELVNIYPEHDRPYIYIQRITMCPHGYHHNGFIVYIYAIKSLW